MPKSTKFLERYKIIHPLSGNSNHTVFLGITVDDVVTCLHKKLNKGTPVVLKTINLPISEENHAEKDCLLHNEFCFLRELNHPNIIEAYDFISAPNPFLVMPYIEEQVTSFAKLPFTKDAEQWTGDFYRVSQDISSALTYLHAQDLIHGDIRLPNILLHKDRAVLIDFELIHKRRTHYLVLPTSGTTSSKAPEQFHGRFSTKSDIYSFGVMQYRILTAKSPRDPGLLKAYENGTRNHVFRRKIIPIHDHNPCVPVRLEELVHASLEINPAYRPTAHELYNIVGGLQKNSQATAHAFNT